MNEQFAFGRSIFHALDPRGKIIAVGTFTVILALTNQYSVAGASLFIGVIFLFISRLDPNAVARRLLAVNSFTLFLWLTLPLTYGGPSSLTIGPLPLSETGIRLASLITLKTNSIVLIVICLLATSSIGALGHGLHRLRLPAKLCYLLLYSYRYVFVIHQEYSRLRRAARMRNFSPRTTFHTYKTYSYLFGMTVIQSWNRSKRVSQAMLLRGFDGRLVTLDQLRFTKKDYCFLFFVISITAGLLLTGCWWPLPWKGTT